MADAERNDLTILFGTWNINSGRSQHAWTSGTCASTSNANAMQVTIARERDTVFGPVTSLFAQALGYPTTSISATATAYLGYTNEVPTGGVQVPLALPGTGTNSPLASNGRSGWFARLLGPQRGRGLHPQDDYFQGYRRRHGHR